MRHALKLHPDSPCAAVTRIDVDVAHTHPGHLVLTYAVTGKISDLSLPAVTAPARTDELWRHTCFEVFLRASPSAAYREFNFAPSTRWAAYRFDAYREGMAALEVEAPKIEVRSTAELFELQVALQLAGTPARAALRLALSAVIEETNGRKSYWALAHPPGKPDFHHADGFALELQPA